MRATNDFLRTNSEKAVFVMVDDVRDAISSGDLTDRKEIKKPLMS